MVRGKLVPHTPARARMVSHPERIFRAFLLGFPVRQNGEAHALTHLDTLLDFVPAQNFDLKPRPECHLFGVAS